MDKETNATFTVIDSHGMFDAVTVKCRLLVETGDHDPTRPIFDVYNYDQKLCYDYVWAWTSAVSALMASVMVVALVLGTALAFKAWLLMVIFGGSAVAAWSGTAVGYWLGESVWPWPFGKLFLAHRVERAKKALLRHHIKKQAKQKRQLQKAKAFEDKLRGFYGTVQVDWDNRRMING